MLSHPPFRKIAPGVASRSDILVLLNRYDLQSSRQKRCVDTAYAGEWFEIGKVEYDHMLDTRPPIFVRPGAFSVSEFKGGTVAMVLITLNVIADDRCFMGFCELRVSNSPEMLKEAIVACETNRHFRRLGHQNSTAHLMAENPLCF